MDFLFFVALAFGVGALAYAFAPAESKKKWATIVGGVVVAVGGYVTDLGNTLLGLVQ